MPLRFSVAMVYDLSFEGAKGVGSLIRETTAKP